MLRPLLGQPLGERQPLAQGPHPRPLVGSVPGGTRALPALLVLGQAGGLLRRLLCLLRELTTAQDGTGGDDRVLPPTGRLTPGLTLTGARTHGR
ncbi:hypothetical protein [Streptomyces albus]|uniref:hypothetical protein n=1 Tax=Streptomyces albus TaxID=1888 RepID=UPI0005A6F90C